MDTSDSIYITIFAKKVNVMLDKRIVIELIKCIEKIQFTEQIEGDAVIGYINDHGRVIQVSFLADNLGQYLQLSYPIKSVIVFVYHLISVIYVLNGRKVKT